MLKTLLNYRLVIGINWQKSIRKISPQQVLCWKYHCTGTSTSTWGSSTA